MTLLRALMLLALLGCHQPDRAVPASADNAATRAPIERFVAAGRTPAAFAILATQLEATRRADASTVAEEAEVRLLALAQPLAETARRSTIADEIDALGLTVWPALLDTPLTATDALDVAPRAGENASSYFARLCDGVLRTECGDLAPEYQPMAVRAAAMRRGSERMRAALAGCTRCGLATESGWRELGWKWESVARSAARDFIDLPARPQQAALDRRTR